VADVGLAHQLPCLLQARGCGSAGQVGLAGGSVYCQLMDGPEPEFLALEVGDADVPRPLGLEGDVEDCLGLLLFGFRAGGFGSNRPLVPGLGQFNAVAEGIVGRGGARVQGQAGHGLHAPKVQGELVPCALFAARGPARREVAVKGGAASILLRAKFAQVIPHSVLHAEGGHVPGHQEMQTPHLTRLKRD